MVVRFEHIIRKYISIYYVTLRCVVRLRLRCYFKNIYETIANNFPSGPTSVGKYSFQIIIIRQKHPKILAEFVRTLQEPSLSRINDSLYWKFNFLIRSREGVPTRGTLFKHRITGHLFTFGQYGFFIYFYTRFLCTKIKCSTHFLEYGFMLTFKIR